MSLLKAVAGSEEEKASKQLSVRLKPSQLELLKTEAEAGNTSVNELVSRLVNVAAQLPSFAPSAAAAFSSFLTSPKVISELSDSLTAALQDESKRKIRGRVRPEYLDVVDVDFWPATAEFSIKWKLRECHLDWPRLATSGEKVHALVDGRGTLLLAPGEPIRLSECAFGLDVQVTKPKLEEGAGFIDDDLPF